MNSHIYPTNLTDAEWDLLRPLLEPSSHRGRPRRHPVRVVVNAILYVLRTGCAWRFLPREWPPWTAIFYHFRKWRLDGTWERVHAHLRERERLRLGRGGRAGL